MTTPSSQLHSQQQLLLLLLLLLPVILAGAADEQPPMPRPDCPDKCGHISIPFPFGIGPGCFREGFEVLCNHSRAFLPDRAVIEDTGYFNGSKVPVYNHYLPLELVSISVGTGEVRAYAPVSYICTNGTANFSNVLTIDSTFRVSMTRNVLIGVGFRAESELSYDTLAPSVHCRSYYIKYDSTNGSCTGVGCCTLQAPADIGSSQYVVFSVSNYESPLDSPGYDPAVDQCNYGMLVETSWYNFSMDDLDGNMSLLKRFPQGVPIVLDFAAGNTSCPAEGQPPPPHYTCVSGNSSCANTTSNTLYDGGSVGYFCKCLEHYDGNPYLPNGCQDIDECKQLQVYPCSNGGICKNRLEGYDCPCYSGMKDDGKGGPCTDVRRLWVQ